MNNLMNNRRAVILLAAGLTPATAFAQVPIRGVDRHGSGPSG